MLSQTECNLPPVGSLARVQHDAAEEAAAHPTMAASGAPLADPEVAKRCGAAPYNTVMPPAPPDWSEWFAVPVGCAAHLEQNGVIGRSVRAECRSDDGGGATGCSTYSAIRFQKEAEGWSAPEVISFTMVPRRASDRLSWDAPPTDLSGQ